MRKIILYIVIILTILVFLVKSHHTILNVPHDGKIKQIELREVFRIIGEDEQERYFLEIRAASKPMSREIFSYWIKTSSWYSMSRGNFCEIYSREERGRAK